MNPEQFLQRISKEPPAPVYLFLGPELYQLGLCRRALIEKILAPADREEGFSRHDLDQTTLAAVLDDARSLSLFARERIVWVASAESALPRSRTAGEEEKSAANELAEYVRHPTPGTVLVFEASRYGFEGDDRAKSERVHKFYSAIPHVVEFQAYSIEAARRLAQDLAKKAGLQIGLAEIGLLVESLAADPSRISNEIEKLRLYTAAKRKVTADDIVLLAPDAYQSTLFALVNALGRGDRKRSIDCLDALLRAGEYLPLALTFLATQLRLAMAARDEGLRTAPQIQAYFTKEGIRIWRDRAEQVHQTMTAFPGEKLARAIEKVFWADKAFRDTRPDDRVVMEDLVFSLTA